MDQLEQLKHDAAFFAERYVQVPSYRDVGTTKSMRVRPQQRIILEANTPLNTVRGQRALGISTALLAKLLHAAFVRPGLKALVIDPYQFGLKWHFERLKEVLQADAALWHSVKKCRMSKGIYEIVLTNGSRISGEYLNHHRKRNIIGETPNFILIFEASYISNTSWAGITPMFTPTEVDVPRPVVWVSGTPCLYKAAKDKAKYDGFEKMCGYSKQYPDWHDWWFPARHIPDYTFTGEYIVGDDGFFLPGESAQILCTMTNPWWRKDHDDLQRRMLGDRGYTSEILAGFEVPKGEF